MGRFLSADPIGFGGGVNFYAYVENNPVNYIDALGLEAWYHGLGNPQKCKSGDECPELKWKRNLNALILSARLLERYYRKKKGLPIDTGHDMQISNLFKSIADCEYLIRIKCKKKKGCDDENEGAPVGIPEETVPYQFPSPFYIPPPIPGDYPVYY